MSSSPVAANIAALPATNAWEVRTVLRHRWPLRVMHWTNLVCLLVLVGSGLQIFNAHSALYWGQASHFQAPLFAAQAVLGTDGQLRGITQIGSQHFDTTGVLGASDNARGQRVRYGFPRWSTIPGSRDLALGRRWHFFFAWVWVINGLCYLAWSLASRHLQRDLAMTHNDWRAIPASIREHVTFHHPVGDDAARYNPLQKLAYLLVIFVLAPLALITGLSMSPQMDTVLGGWLQLIGGRQSARTLHFIAMSLFVLFALVHVLMVFYAGPINELRSMITGRFKVRYPVKSCAAPHPDKTKAASDD